MYIWKSELGVIGNLMALIADHNSNYCNTENYHAADLAQINETDAEMSITFVTLAESGAIDEVTAAEHATLFADWQENINYVAGNIRHYGDKLYKCLQAHTSQAGWEPGTAVSLWKVIGDPTEEYPEWSQPVGSGDGYRYGAKVTHNEQRWVSTYEDENVWEPGVFGWVEVQGK